MVRRLSEKPIDNGIRTIRLENCHFLPDENQIIGIVTEARHEADCMRRQEIELTVKVIPAGSSRYVKANNVNIEINTKKENEMSNNAKYKNLAALLRDDIVTVNVKYINVTDGKEYMYKVHKSVAETLAKGDMVMVEVGEDNKPQIAYVVRVHPQCFIEPDSSIVYRWVMGKVDMTVYNEQKAIEELNANKLLDEHRVQTRRRFIDAQGVGSVQMLTKLPQASELDKA